MNLQIGWRYTRAGRAGRRNGFISFISGVSMLGIALGVAALIIVLSVMNGFQKEVRDRMLSVISHVEVFESHGNALPDWRPDRGAGAPHPAGDRRGALHRLAGADRARRRHARRAGARHLARATKRPSPTSPRSCKDTTLARLVPGDWGIVLGVELARTLGVREGDKVTLVAPGGQVTPAGVVPRLKQLTVVGTFDAGHYEYDSGAGAGAPRRCGEAVPRRRARPACSCA